MKRTFTIVSFLVVFTLVMAACTDAVPTSAPAADATDPAVVVVDPPATEAPVEAPTDAPAGIVPIDLAGPPMQVGSKYTYVDGSVLAAVPGGPFVMGYNNYYDTPEKEVTLGDYWIYSSEVTNGQYALCVNSGKCTPPNAEQNPAYGNYRLINLPIVGVNYQQAVDYCTFVRGRLPTEAEWEKAARGPEGNIFPWGDEAPVCDLLNFNFCKGKTLDIQSYPDGVSFYGLFDMSGNVREWVADWYDDNYYTDGPTEDPLGPELGQKRSVRSSSFSDTADFAFPAHRFSFRPEDSLADLGFRCVVEDPTVFAPFCEQLAYTGYGPDGEQKDCVPGVACNDVNITESRNCAGYNNPYTIITFSMANTPPNTWAYDAPGCTPLGGDKFECLPGDGPDAKVTGSCSIDANACAPGCPAHYVMNGDSCVWDGSGTQGTECLPGMTYDPLTQCCSATPGTGVDFNLCPAGSYPLNGVCVASPAAVVDSAAQIIGFDACQPPDNSGGDDDSTGCPVQTCKSYEKFCSNTCSCIYNTFSC